MIYKPVRISEDFGLLIALIRVRDGRVFVHGAEFWTDKGRPLPRMLVPFMRKLFDHGHARIPKPEDNALEQQAQITSLGEGFLLELEATTMAAASRSSTVDGSR